MGGRIVWPLRLHWRHLHLYAWPPNRETLRRCDLAVFRTLSGRVWEVSLALPCLLLRWTRPR